MCSNYREVRTHLTLSSAMPQHNITGAAASRPERQAWQGSAFAAGTPTPMLLASDETLPRFQETDRNIKHRDKEGRPVTYGDLLEKADPKLAHMVAPEHLVARQNVARAAVRICARP